MEINNFNQFLIIDQNLNLLNVSGANNRIIIKSHVRKINVTGANNQIDGTDRNCLVFNLCLFGSNNEIILNNNCSDVKKSIHGSGNNVKFIGANDNNSNYDNFNNFMGNNIFQHDMGSGGIS